MAEGSCLNLKYLKLFGCILNKSESLLIKFPMLEECILQDQLLHSEQIYNEIIDFSSLQKLKYLECEKADFIYLKDSILEKVILYSKNKDEFYKSNEYEIEKKTIEKLISINTLKSIYIILKKIDDCEIAKIKGKNNSVTDIYINWNNENDCILYSLQNKFINLRNISIKILTIKNNTPSLKIKPNPNSNIKKFTLSSIGNGVIGFYIESYINLGEINLILDNDIDNLEEIFPIFNNNCDIIFTALTNFNLTYHHWKGISTQDLNNFINNIDKMPSLNKFTLICNSYITKENYNKLKRKILSLNLNYANISINNIPNLEKLRKNDDNNGENSKRLKRICCNFDTANLNKLYINKYKE